MCPRGFGAEEPFDTREVAELLPDPLDLGGPRPALLAELGELRAACLVVAEELLRARAAADLLEEPAHPLLGAVVDDARAPRAVAGLGDVGHGAPHVRV